MDDPLSRALREDEEQSRASQQKPDNELSTSVTTTDGDVNEPSAALSISHSHNEWILPSPNERNREAEVNHEHIKIYVCDPKKHKSNLDSFITYLITTQIFNDGVKINESNVRRRYNDFVWLKSNLDAKYPFNIISTLPIKHTLSKKLHVVADDGEFIRRRMIGQFHVEHTSILILSLRHSRLAEFPSAHHEQSGDLDRSVCAAVSLGR